MAVQTEEEVLEVEAGNAVFAREQLRDRALSCALSFKGLRKQMKNLAEDLDTSTRKIVRQHGSGQTILFDAPEEVDLPAEKMLVQDAEVCLELHGILRESNNPRAIVQAAKEALEDQR